MLGVVFSRESGFFSGLYSQKTLPPGTGPGQDLNPIFFLASQAEEQLEITPSLSSDSASQSCQELILSIKFLGQRLALGSGEEKWPILSPPTRLQETREETLVPKGWTLGLQGPQAGGRTAETES